MNLFQEVSCSFLVTETSLMYVNSDLSVTKPHRNFKSLSHFLLCPSYLKCISVLLSVLPWFVCMSNCFYHTCKWMLVVIVVNLPYPKPVYYLLPQASTCLCCTLFHPRKWYHHVFSRYKFQKPLDYPLALLTHYLSQQMRYFKNNLRISYFFVPALPPCWSKLPSSHTLL